jgi:hypothetical protein
MAGSSTTVARPSGFAAAANGEHRFVTVTLPMLLLPGRALLLLQRRRAAKSPSRIGLQ